MKRALFKRPMVVWSLYGGILALLFFLAFLPLIVGFFHWRWARYELRGKGEKLYPEEFPVRQVAQPGYFQQHYFSDAGTAEAKRLGFYEKSKGLSPDFEKIRDEVVASMHLAYLPDSNAAAVSEESVWDKAMTLAAFLQAHAEQALKEGDLSTAREDILALFALTKAGVKGGLFWEFYRSNANKLVIEAGSKWSKEDFEAFGRAWEEPVSTLSDVANDLRRERAQFNQKFDRRMAKGWDLSSVEEDPPIFWQKEWYLQLARARFNLLMQEWIEACEVSPPSPERFEQLKLKSPSIYGDHPLSSYFGHETGGGLHLRVREQLSLQNETSLFRIVHALRNYREAHGSYPEKLGALVPEFMSSLPEPLSGDRSFQYEKSGEGGCQVSLRKNGFFEERVAMWVR